MNRLRSAAFAWLLSSLAAGCAAGHSGLVDPNADLNLPDKELPNGKVEACTVRRDEANGDTRALVVLGLRGLFTVVLPEASDWKLECDRAQLFWAFSKTRRMEVTVHANRPQPGEAASASAYLTAVGAAARQKFESHGLRVTHSELSELERDETLGERYALELTVDAPAHQLLALLPQDTFITTRPGPQGTQFDAHITTHYRTPDEQAALHSDAHQIMRTFVVAPKSDIPAQEFAP